MIYVREKRKEISLRSLKKNIQINPRISDTVKSRNNKTEKNYRR